MILDAQGNTVKSKFIINEYIDDSQWNPQGLLLKDGNIFITWTSSWPLSIGQDGSGVGVYGKIINSSGNTIKSEFRINDYTNGNQYNYSTPPLLLANGNIFVTLMSETQDGSGYGVYAKIYNANGIVLNSEF